MIKQLKTTLCVQYAESLIITSKHSLVLQGILMIGCRLVESDA